MASCGAIAAAAAACQGHVDVQVAEHLPRRPTGLYVLVIAESGERKTTVDKLFREGFEQAERDMAEYNTDKVEMSAGDTATIKEDLAAHLLTEPKPLRQFAVLLQDATTEAIKKCFVVWPVRYLAVNEGGLVFGGGYSHETRNRDKQPGHVQRWVGWGEHPGRPCICRLVQDRPCQTLSMPSGPAGCALSICRQLGQPDSWNRIFRTLLYVVARVDARHAILPGNPMCQDTHPCVQ